MPVQSLIIGCGYVGLPLALQLQEEGRQVAVWVRSQAGADALEGHHFHRIITGNVADDGVWQAVNDNYDLVIHCASSGRGDATVYEDVFHRGVLRMNAHQPRARRLFVSSSSVYGQTRGEVVTEESPAEPVAATSRVLREAERVAMDAGAIVVRSSGIYGPGRGVLFDKFRRGEAVIEGEGTRWINQIHQRDLVAALAHLAQAGVPGQVYNATDDTPVTTRDFYAWCAGFLQKPMPPDGPVHLQRKRGLTNKRVSNAKLRATGWRPHYPSFREGLAAGCNGRAF